ncbi:hypothetical protein SAMN05216188_1197 [Lentzea xinjiangensis]|uniref:Transposase n=1 Tax=Lentzea xinjiangensis TaxID=402600 RepID=A0A1H9TQL6_9PSEU|nr:hypothetical protein [Lentzea xinjiangensis]SER99317.1 hypothetical protein SAMN05216188_1197 [Lentzea xinjiangensis]
MGRREYPPESRRKVLDLIEAGRKVADVAGTWRSETRRSTPGDDKIASTADSSRG